MAIEIERKFKVISDEWKKLCTKKSSIRQGYLQSGLDEAHRSSIRVRIADDRASLNIKSADMSVYRTEYEYVIPLEDAEHMMMNLCEDCIIEKTRYYVPHDSRTWEVDIFHGANEGLIIAEIELDTVQDSVCIPDWIGEEVSNDSRFYNNYLINRPFKYWQE